MKRDFDSSIRYSTASSVEKPRTGGYGIPLAFVGTITVSSFGLALFLLLFHPPWGEQENVSTDSARPEKTRPLRSLQNKENINPRLRRLFTETTRLHGSLFALENSSDDEWICPSDYVWNPKEANDEVGRSFSRVSGSGDAGSRYANTGSSSRIKAPRRGVRSRSTKQTRKTPCVKIRKRRG